MDSLLSKFTNSQDVPSEPRIVTRPGDNDRIFGGLHHKFHHTPHQAHSHYVLPFPYGGYGNHGYGLKMGAGALSGYGQSFGHSGYGSTSPGQGYGVSHAPTYIHSYYPHHDSGSSSGGHHRSHKSKSIAMSALTLLAFLFFLNILQSCLKEHMDAMNPTVMVMTSGSSRNKYFRSDETSDKVPEDELNFVMNDQRLPTTNNDAIHRSLDNQMPSDDPDSLRNLTKRIMQSHINTN